MQTDSWAHQGVHPHKDSFTFFSSLYDRAVCVKTNYYGSKIRRSRKIAGSPLEVRRKSAGSPPKVRWKFAEKPPEVRRKSAGGSPNQQKFD